MKIQILWKPPAENRIGSGDIRTRAELEELGIDVDAYLSRGDAQIIEEEPAPRTKRSK